MKIQNLDYKFYLYCECCEKFVFGPPLFHALCLVSYPVRVQYLLDFAGRGDESDNIFKGKPANKNSLGNFKEIFFLCGE